jgi:hypothetical protein
MVLVNQYMLRLRKILLSDIFYLIILILSLIYAIVFIKNYYVKSIYSINDRVFYLIIKSIKIDGDKLSLEFSNNLIGNYYFKHLII